MKIFFRLITVTIMLLSAAISTAKPLRIIAPATLVDVGIISALVADFKTIYPEINIAVHSTGALKVIEMAYKGEADLIFSHYPKGEKIFINKGLAKYSAEIMYNYFAVLGPTDHHLNLQNIHSLKSLLHLFVEQSVIFMSPHPRSGTAQRLKDLMALSGVNKEWNGFYSSDTSTKETLYLADENEDFTFSDMGTYLYNQKKLGGYITPVFRDDIALQNRVKAIVLNEKKFSGINNKGATLFWKYLIGERAQLVIREFNGENFNSQIFTPIAHLDANVMALRSKQVIKQQHQEFILLSGVIVLMFLLIISILIFYWRNNRANKLRQQIENRFLVAMDSSQEGIWDWNLLTEECYLSYQCQYILGVETKQNEIITDPKQWFNSHLEKGYWKDIWKTIKQNIKQKNNAFFSHVMLQNIRGIETRLSIRGRVILDQNNFAVNVIGSVTDITQQYLQEQKLEHFSHIALHDSLTTLPNRLMLMQHLTHEIMISERNKTPITLFLLDLDRFKAVNDNFGHHVGDELLIQVAERLQECVKRKSDLVARLGGDEFVVLLPNLNSDKAIALNNEMTTTIRNIEVNSQKNLIDVSIGIAEFPLQANNAEELIKLADRAMYKAKSENT